MVVYLYNVEYIIYNIREFTCLLVKELPGLAFFGREGRRLGRKESVWGNPRVRSESRFHHKQTLAYIE